MKLTFLLIPILFLSSCTIDWNDKKDTHITSLTDTINEQNKVILNLSGALSGLQKENANLQKENELMKSGGDAQAIENMYGTEGDGFTYSESNYDSCMKDAHDGYIGAGSELCIKAGFSSGEILANKCDLDTPTITNLQQIKSDAEAECKNLYQ